jgi:hypothetical protein
MLNKILFIATILLLAFSNSVNAQNIKAKAPNNQNMDVRCDANGYLITSAAGGGLAADVRLRDATAPAAFVTVAHPNADDLDPAVIYGMSVMSGGYCLDAGNMWDRVHCGSVAATGCQCIAPPTDARFIISATTAVNSAANPIYNRLSADGTSAVDATHPLPVSPTAAANVQANPFYCAVSKDGTVNSASNPIAGRISVDGTNYLSSTNPIPISATNAANTAVNPVYVSKSGVAVVSPAKTTTLNIAGTLVDVLASVEVLGYPNFCITLKNNDALNSLTDAAIFQSPDGSAWENLSWTACDTLAPATSCSYCVSGNAYRYIKVQAKAAGASTVATLDAWLTANAN